MGEDGQWYWRRRRSHSFGFWELVGGERSGESVGPIPIDKNGRAEFIPAPPFGTLSNLDRARGLAESLSSCPDDAQIAGIREVGAEIVTLLSPTA